jgi:hypothetical protein
VRDRKPEKNVPPDPQVAGGRNDGGVPEPRQTTTGGGENRVGRLQGQDVGYAEETGAERRAEAASDE